MVSARFNVSFACWCVLSQATNINSQVQGRSRGLGGFWHRPGVEMALVFSGNGATPSVE